MSNENWWGRNGIPILLCLIIIFFLSDLAIWSFYSFGHACVAMVIEFVTVLILICLPTEHGEKFQLFN